ncbi:MAG: carboxypeptidase-like regulatory domain-containing protein [Bacteroidales bacterium]|nr:carboxypeptidase-like regulatory domain-containing protein [Bacteroidales bacterium]
MRYLRVVLFSAFFLVFSAGSLSGQFFFGGRSDEKLIQFSGIIRNLEHVPVGHANIVILNKERGTTADGRGLFSFVVQPNDTVIFSHIGYKPTIHIIPDSLTVTHYPSDIFMVSDTFKLSEVKIYPWKTYAEFKEAFISMETPGDDEQRAMKNIALIKTQIKMGDAVSTPTMNFREVMQQQYNQLYYEGQYPYYTIFDPIRWAEFFDAIKRGDFKRDD